MVTPFGLFAVLITVTALLAYLNERFLRLPPAIGVMAGALVFSLVLTAAGQAGFVVDRWAEELFQQIDFSAVLMNAMLSFLLFAGALHVDLEQLLQRKWTILSLSTFGVVLSTFLVGTAFYYLLRAFGIEVPYIHALLFGALISPTDPVAVLGILRTAKAPKPLESMVIGESLFNDGVGVVMFTMILGLSGGHHAVSGLGVGTLFLQEAVGGVVFGLVLGYLAYVLLRGVNAHTVEILITLALVSGGYVLAGKLHTSGPIAMVVAGLFIGNHGRVFGMSDETRVQLDRFWELIDEILNALLFVMIGFELLILELRPIYLLIGVIAILGVLAIRFGSVGLPIAFLSKTGIRKYAKHTVAVMTWAGVRGGISIALALSIPPSPSRDIILVVTYCVVIFSILVQGLSLGRVVRWATRSA